MKPIEMWHGDCLDLMDNIPDASVDLAILDIPYAVAEGTRKKSFTRNAWDSPVDLDALWSALLRTCKRNAPMLFFCNMRLACALISSKSSLFRYDILWEEPVATGFLNARKMPLRCHEHVLVFYKSLPFFLPHKVTSHKRANAGKNGPSSSYGSQRPDTRRRGEFERYPRSVQRFGDDERHRGNQRTSHPTQKPLSLIRWLIMSYSQKDDRILDPTFGGGSTAHACVQTQRKFVGCEKEKVYFDVAVERVKDAMRLPVQSTLPIQEPQQCPA